MHPELLFPKDGVVETGGVETGRIEDPGHEAPSVPALAEAWRALSLPSGSVVLVSMPNGAGLLRLFLAIGAAGYVPAPIPPTTPSLRVRHLARDYRAGAIVRTRIPDALADEIGLARRIDQAGWQVGLFSPEGPPLTEPGEVVLTTSGTSSEFSSGCVHSLAALRRNGLRHAGAIGLRACDTVLVTLPLYYSFALVAQALAAFEVGARLVVGGPPFVPGRYFDDLEAHGVTVTSLTPVLVRQVLDRPARPFPDGLRALTIGGDRIAPEDVAALRARHPRTEIYLTYGLAEAGPRVSTLAAHLAAPARLASVGRPLPGTEIRLLPVGGDPREGELLVHSDTLLRRKIGRAAETHTTTLDGRRWLRTGDIFHLDEDGYLFFRSRRSDLIFLDGEKVNLGAVRSLCRSFPGVVGCTTSKTARDGGRTGYALEVVVDEEAVSEDAAKSLARRLLGGLRRGERPERLTLRRVSPVALTNHK